MIPAGADQVKSIKNATTQTDWIYNVSELQNPDTARILEEELSSVTGVLFDLDGVLILGDEATNAAIGNTCKLATEKYPINSGDLETTLQSKARELWLTSPTAEYSASLGISAFEGLCATFLPSNYQSDNSSLQALREWAPGYKVKAWQGALSDMGIKDASLALHLAEQFPLQQAALYASYPDAIAIIRSVQETHVTAVITNGVSDLQRSKLLKTGLIGLFPESAIVVSSEVGIGKPHERIYREAAQRMGEEVKKIVIIEDRSRNIVGAQKIGMKGVLVDRTNNPSDLRALKIGALHQLIPLLKK